MDRRSSSTPPREETCRAERSELVIAVDSREQKPYLFSGCEVKTLKTGDYSIVGLEDQIALERKTKEDAYASLGRSRARFERELERLSKLDYAAIVVESSLPEFLHPPPFTPLSPRAAINSLIAWTVRYRVGVFFAGDRRHGHALVHQLLQKYWHFCQKGTHA
jgi:DNA excision repair protein ERCC-4